MADVTEKDMALGALAIQNMRKKNFGAVALAFAGTSFKSGEFAAAKRYQRNVRKGAPITVIDAGTFKKGSTFIKMPASVWGIVAALHFELTSSIALPQAVMNQIIESLEVDLQRAGQNSAKNGLRAFIAGISQVQGSADGAFPIHAGPLMPINEMLIDGDADVKNPLDFLNPEESFTLEIDGLNAIAAAGGFVGTVKATPFVFTYEAHKRG
jgi:hypothetical protein